MGAEDIFTLFVLCRNHWNEYAGAHKNDVSAHDQMAGWTSLGRARVRLFSFVVDWQT
jgi:hypothetical protein